MLMEIKVVRQILEWNEDCSNEIKEHLKDKKVFMVNVMGSPGCGKTSLIIELIKQLSDRYRVGVIEGDIAGQVDAEKIDTLGIPVVQLNTDGSCHIEAMAIKNVLGYFNLDEIDVIFIENIGNLVCPAEFNLGEDTRIAVLSVPEGDDKVEKYPLMFATTNTLVIHKYDMLPYFNFDYNKVYYSPLKRTLETFEILGLEGIEERRIREINFGIFTGKTYNEILELYPEESKLWVDDSYNYKMLEGESLSEVYTRLVEFLEEISKGEENVLLVCHDCIIRLAMCWIFDNPDYFFKFKIDNGSINVLSIDEEGFKYIKKSNYN